MVQLCTFVHGHKTTRSRNSFLLKKLFLKKLKKSQKNFRNRKKLEKLEFFLENLKIPFKKSTTMRIC